RAHPAHEERPSRRRGARRHRSGRRHHAVLGRRADHRPRRRPPAGAAEALRGHHPRRSPTPRPRPAPRQAPELHAARPDPEPHAAVTDLAAPRTPATAGPLAERDPARWATLAIVIVAAFIIVLDNTVLNVAIPTILRDFDTTLPSVEWVITGYALTFATLLIIGGRLGDIYGHRRIFMVGLVFFAAGSFLAPPSQGVHELILGEAVIEGIGASLMLPTTLAILSDTFHGRERATAFAAWGATAGVASALGPVVGGFLTSNYS